MPHGLSQTTAPTELAITLDEARQQCDLRPDSSAYNAELDSYIRAAQEYVGSMLGVALSVAKYTFTRNGFTTEDAPRVYLPLSPVVSVEAVNYTNSTGSNLLDPSEYDVITDQQKGFIYPVSSWPGTVNHPQSLSIDFTAGWTLVPENYRQLVRILVAHYFQVKAPVSNPGLAEVPMTLQTLIYNCRTGAEFKCY